MNVNFVSSAELRKFADFIISPVDGTVITPFLQPNFNLLNKAGQITCEDKAGQITCEGKFYLTLSNSLFLFLTKRE